jgi:hypothetical protein
VQNEIWEPYEAYGVQVLSIGYHADVDSALRWQIENGLTYPVLSDRNGNVTLSYTNIFQSPLLPWDAIVGVDNVLALTDIYTQPDSVWLAAVVDVLDSLFDPQFAADPETLDFGLISLLPAQMTLWLENAGTGLLDIQAITSSSAYFTPNPTLGQIYAVDDSLEVTVVFVAAPFGEFEGILTIAATQDTLEIPMTAQYPDAVEPQAALPNGFAVSCFPNPFNAELTLHIELQKPQQVKAELFSVTGERQALLFHGPMIAGNQQIRWSDEAAPSGVYLLQVSGTDWSEIRKVILLR